MKSLFPLEILWFSFILSLRDYGIPGPCSWPASRKPRSVSFLLPVVHAKDAWVSQLGLSDAVGSHVRAQWISLPLR